MRIWLTIFLLVAAPAFGGSRAAADVYLVYYATVNGKTGHVGIAVDNYKIIIREQWCNGSSIEVEDTVATGELTYYDLWPAEDDFNVFSTGRDMPAVYYQLPVSSTEEITLNTLRDKGIPHKERYACDGILRFPTHWRQDDSLRRYLDQLMAQGRAFNARSFNCTDFVKLAFEKLLGTPLDATEFILVGRSATPNALYRELRTQPGVIVVKNADALANGRFLSERILQGSTTNHYP